ncbi:MAG TPA: universal stress protein [Solirubrobacteraceae bacterium]|nr:universal stress protein [Solirubrobacteraceae bacterium]
MSTKLIVSYDGTANENDAIALGGVFARAGAEVSIAYVRHTQEPDSDRESLAQHEAQALLERGARLLGSPVASTHVVTDRSTPEGLRALAAQIGASMVVFCSDSHTAKGHVTIGNSAERLLEGGPVAVAIAPAGLAEADGVNVSVKRIVAVGEAGGGAAAHGTARALASALGAEVVPVADESTDLLVIDSRPEAQAGRISISSSASHLIEIATSSVLVLPQGVNLSFGGSPVGAAA